MKRNDLAWFSWDRTVVVRLKLCLAPQVDASQSPVAQREPKVQFSILVAVFGVIVRLYMTPSGSRLKSHCWRSLVVKPCTTLFLFDCSYSHKPGFEIRQYSLLYQAIEDFEKCFVGMYHILKIFLGVFALSSIDSPPS